MIEEQRQSGSPEGVPPLEPLEPPESPEPPSPDPEAESPEAAPRPVSSADAVFEFRALPVVLWRIVRNPETGLGDAHVPGRAGLLHGLVLGGVAVVAISVIRLTDEQSLLISWLGGVTFLAVGALVSLILRSVAGKSGQADWNADVFLVGAFLCYSLVGAVLSLVIGLVPALEGLATAVGLAGFLLGAFAFAEGLVDIGRVEDSRRIWIAVAVLTIASAVANMLDFVPLA